MLLVAQNTWAQKPTFSNQSSQPDSQTEESGLAYVASGDWRVEREPAQPTAMQGNPYYNPGYQPASMPMNIAAYPPGYMPMGQMPGMAPYGVAPVGYQQQLMPPVNMQGNMNGPVMPAGYSAGYSSGGEPESYCADCNDSGCGSCRGLFGGGAFCGFGRGIGQPWDMSEYGGKCAPRWFDIGAEATYFTLETDSESQVLSSLGVTGSNVALRTGDTSYDHAAGMRFTANMVFWAGSNLEFSYIGMNNFAGLADASATAGANGLYSPMSNFGTNPAGGYTETDQSSYHSIAESNRFDSFELNIKRGFTTPGCWWQGSYWGGLRYFGMEDDSRYFTRNDSGDSMSYLNETRSDLYGVQIGGDLSLILTQRLSWTGYSEIGVYGATNKQNTAISLTGGSNAVVNETIQQKRGSMLVEAGTFGNFRINSRASVKIGYQALYVNGVALAIDGYNFDTNAGGLPAALAGRSPFMDDNGAALYHGATAGFEMVW
ncbi:MAG: hypothetical protein COA78_23555 [Blastopirellula sp.]|nr:MAG: hypothetical protein COA78_23555 [Blastopirellula sp.]